MSEKLLVSKFCTKCEKDRPSTDFYVVKTDPPSLRGPCKECVKSQTKAWYEKNKDMRKITISAWQAANAEKMAADRKAWAKANPQCVRNATRKWKANNRPTINEYKRSYRHKNPAAVAKHEMARRTAERQAYVSWADQSLIRDIYSLARIASKCTGIRFEVDHIIPLRGRTVSGLHVENNLTIVTRSENAQKSNKF